MHRILMPGLWGEGRIILPPGFAGMHWNQERTPQNCIVAKARWFNGAGEKVGEGDLAARDIRQLMAALPEGEYFIVLDQFRGRRAGDQNLEYIQQYCSYIVGRNQSWFVLNDFAVSGARRQLTPEPERSPIIRPGEPELGSYSFKGHQFACIRRSHIAKFFTASSESASPAGEERGESALS